MRNPPKLYKQYSITYNRQVNRWFAYLKQNGKRQYVTSASSLDGLRDKLDKNPTPVLFGNIYSTNDLIDPRSLEAINKCRESLGYSTIEIKARVCLKCRKEFLSISNRLCVECHRTNGTVSDLGEFSISIE